MGILEIIGAALIAIIGAFFVGKRKGKADERTKQDQDYIDARKRMDAVVVDDDSGSIREWLHERAKQGNL